LPAKANECSQSPLNEKVMRQAEPDGQGFGEALDEHVNESHGFVILVRAGEERRAPPLLVDEVTEPLSAVFRKLPRQRRCQQDSRRTQ
jgi:hypothetical protein